MKILAVSGSLRRGSHNTKPLRAAAELVDDDIVFELCEGLKALPPYDEEDDAERAPAASRTSARRSPAPTPSSSRRPSTTRLCPGS